MRRMNYDRFAKPFNFGEWDDENKRFVLDKPIEEGLYVIETHTNGDMDAETSLINIKFGFYCTSNMFFSGYVSDPVIVEYQETGPKYLEARVVGQTTSPFEPGTIIELYKLD